MFGLLHNLYLHVKKKSERRLTLVTLGLDNAGKSTLIATLQGELDKEVSPTFGFQSASLTEGKYKVEIFDLGGSKNVRRIWKGYFSEVHAVIYVVDAAAPERFEESKAALHESLALSHLHDKPVLVFANKQDLATAARPADVAASLGLDTLSTNAFNIVGCTARCSSEKPPDPRVRDGFRWVVSQVNAVFPPLDKRVQAEAAVVREEEARKKKEREELARKMKEERLRRQLEAEAAEQAAAERAGPQPVSEPVAPSRAADALGDPADAAERGLAMANRAFASTLPNQIESPGQTPKGDGRQAAAAPSGGKQALDSPMGARTFSDPFAGEAAADAAAASGQVPLPSRPPLAPYDEVSGSRPSSSVARAGVVRPLSSRQGSLNGIGSNGIGSSGIGSNRTSATGSRPIEPSPLPAALQDAPMERSNSGSTAAALPVVWSSIGTQGVSSGVGEAEAASDWGQALTRDPALEGGLAPVATGRPASGVATGTCGSDSTPNSATDVAAHAAAADSPVSTLGSIAGNKVVPVDGEVRPNTAGSMS